jgi:alkylhydroperoxidase family enzyme
MSTDTPVLPRLPMLGLSDIPDEHRAAYLHIAESRHGMPFSFAAFFNSPGAAAALAQYGDHIRFSDGLPFDLLETVVMQVAASTSDDFMWAHHHGLALQSGLTEPELATLRSRSPGVPEGASRRETAAALADLVVRDAVTDADFDTAAAVFAAGELVELVFAAAYYSMLHQIFGALRIVGGADTRRPVADHFEPAVPATRSES